MSGTAANPNAIALHQKLRDVPHKPGVYVIRDRFANWAHEIDFDTMTQTSLDTQNSRPIRRVLVESD